MPKYQKIMSYDIDFHGDITHHAEIQVRNFLFWHTVTEISDEDYDYVSDRADEIIDILKNPAR